MFIYENKSPTTTLYDYLLCSAIFISLFPVRYVKQLRTIVNQYVIITISRDCSLHTLEYLFTVSRSQD